MDESTLHTIDEAREILGGISRNTLYDLLREGKLASTPIGRRRFISAVAIEQYVAAATTTQGPQGSGAVARVRT